MKRFMAMGLLMGFVVVGSTFARAEDLKPLGKAKVCTGVSGGAATTIGYKVTIVALEPAKTRRALLKFEEFDNSPWNNKVIMHTMVGSADDGDLVYKSAEMGRPTIDKNGAVRPKGATEDVSIVCAIVDNDTVNPYELINAYKPAAK